MSCLVIKGVRPYICNTTLCCEFYQALRSVFARSFRKFFFGNYLSFNYILFFLLSNLICDVFFLVIGHLGKEYFRHVHVSRCSSFACQKKDVSTLAFKVSLTVCCKSQKQKDIQSLELNSSDGFSMKSHRNLCNQPQIFHKGRRSPQSFRRKRALWNGLSVCPRVGKAWECHISLNSKTSLSHRMHAVFSGVTVDKVALLNVFFQLALKT